MNSFVIGEDPGRVGYCSFRRSWVFERTRCLIGIFFTKHSIKFVFVETNQLVNSNLNVILMWQTFSQRSSMAAGSKREALVIYVSVQICVHNIKM